MSASIIVYVQDVKYLKKTLADIIDKSRHGEFEIVLANSSPDDLSKYDCKVASVEGGPGKLLTAAVELAEYDTVIVVRDTTKITANAFAALQPNLGVTIPAVRDLSPELWSMDGEQRKIVGWRWSLVPYAKVYAGQRYSPAFEPTCFALTKAGLARVGGFDLEMLTLEGVCLDFSMKVWASDQTIAVADVEVAVAGRPESANNLIWDRSRIAEKWLPKHKHLFYDYHGISRPDAGRTESLVLSFDITSWLRVHQPELVSLYALRGAARGRSVAVIGCGPSLDDLNPNEINRHSIIIGTDFIGDVYKCDYVVSNYVDAVSEALRKYRPEQVVTPYTLLSTVGIPLQTASSVSPDLVQFELGQDGMAPRTVFPPFANFQSSIHSAIHFALFLQPSEIVIYGVDNRHVGGRSHTTKVKLFGDGKFWPDTDRTRQVYNYAEYGIRSLSNLGLQNKIPVFRYGYG